MLFEFQITKECFYPPDVFQYDTEPNVPTLNGHINNIRQQIETVPIYKTNGRVAKGENRLKNKLPRSNLANFDKKKKNQLVQKALERDPSNPSNAELKAELERRGDTEQGSNVDMMGRLAVALVWPRAAHLADEVHAPFSSL